MEFLITGSAVEQCFSSWGPGLFISHAHTHTVTHAGAGSMTIHFSTASFRLFHGLTVGVCNAPRIKAICQQKTGKRKTASDEHLQCRFHNNLKISFECVL